MGKTKVEVSDLKTRVLFPNHIQSIMKVSDGKSTADELITLRILKSFLKFGNFTCAMPFTFSVSGHLGIRECLQQYWKVLILALQLSSTFHLLCLPAVVHARDKDTIIVGNLAKWLQTLCLSSQGIWTSVLYISMWLSSEKWKQIFEGFFLVEKEFKTLGIRLLSNRTHRFIQVYLISLFGLGIYGFVSLFQPFMFTLNSNGVPHMILRADQFYSYMFGHLDTTSITIPNALETVQVIIGKFLNLQAMCFSLGLFSILPFMMRAMYKSLNAAMMQSGFKNGVISLDQGMTLHRKLSQIMDKINSAVALSFILFIADFIIQACFFLSKHLLLEVTAQAIATNGFRMIMMIILSISVVLLASVNDNARKALEWFEMDVNMKATLELNPNNLSSFSNRLTFGEIGFSGMGFFVVTKSLVVTIASGILTYVIVIAQLGR